MVIINMKTFDMLKDLMEEEFVDLLNLYIKDAPILFAQIRDSCSKADLEVLLRAAHTLRGSSLNLGAEKLAEVAMNIETAAAKGSLSDAEKLIPGLKSTMIETIKVLKDYQAAQK